MLNLSRANGKIMNETANGPVPLVLAGGQYHLFKSDGLGTRAFLDAQGRVLLRQAANASDEVCPLGPPFAGAQGQDWATWNGLFNQMVNNRCNLLRIFLTNGTLMSAGVPTDIYPFNRTNGKFNIRAAIEAPPGVDGFNRRYFDILKDFALHADERDIALQICIFNYNDLIEYTIKNAAGQIIDNPYYQSWQQSFWNPVNSADPGWGAANLVNIAGNGMARNGYFLDITKAGLQNVQRKFVNRVVECLRGRKNIIFEVMNEPRGAADNAAQARWTSRVVGWILAATGTSRRPIISVNASRYTPTAANFDVDVWKNFTPRDPNYDAVDLFSYHGLTGYGTVQGISSCGAGVAVPAVDRNSINERVTAHRTNHGGKALMFSTDAVFHLGHTFSNLARQTDPTVSPEIDMGRRDGQITTALPNNTTADANTQRRLSDLNNWAYWCLLRALRPSTARGTIHFQNLSSFLASFQSIAAAYNEAAAAAAAAPSEQAVEDAAPAEVTA